MWQKWLAGFQPKDFTLPIGKAVDEVPEQAKHCNNSTACQTTMGLRLTSRMAYHLLLKSGQLAPDRSLRTIDSWV